MFRNGEIGISADFDSVILGSSPGSETIVPLAQLAEHLTFNERAIGSNPIGYTIYAGLIVMVANQSSKLKVRVRISYPAPVFTSKSSKEVLKVAII
jgi:hypothetical protein